VGPAKPGLNHHLSMHSKRYLELKKRIDVKKTYSTDEAFSLLKQFGTSKFDESVELHIRLGIDPKKSDQQIRGTIVLPHGIGKTKKVAAFVEPEKQTEAKEAGADLVGGEELIAEMAKSGKIAFDVAIATAAMMPKLAKIAKLLGPRGLMPNPKTDTVGPNITKMVQEQKSGKINFKNDDTGNVHTLFGRVSFAEAQLKENFLVLIEAIRKAKPSSSKGEFIRNATITTTMGPGIKIELA